MPPRIIAAAVTVLAAAMLGLSSCGKAPVLEATLDVCPQPQIVVPGEPGTFTIDARTKVCYPFGDAELAHIADLLVEDIYSTTGLKLATTDKFASKGIVLSRDRTLAEELPQWRRKSCYLLTVDRVLVKISGVDPEGILHGARTLYKMLPVMEEPVRGKANISLPKCDILDYPQYPYRAFMLDVGRHFFDADYIKRLIDILALHNINYFHWHLTEDQGWRIEIKKYPNLTKIGSYRAGSPVRGKKEHDGVPVSGFYTQEQAREVVAYAAARGITVIPEIDLPGHMQAALASYPELGCTGGPYEVATRYGVLDDVLCAGKPGTMQFVKDVLDEIMDIFPSEYIHLGGDECPKVRWEKCPQCQAKIRELGLHSQKGRTKENLLQSYFMAEVEKTLAERGRRMIGWNDILCDWSNEVCGAPAKSTVIASWMRPVSAAIAAREGYDAIMCPVGWLYFSNAEQNRRVGLDFLDRVYSMPVIPEDLDEEQAAHIIGAEACIWTERVVETSDIEWRLLPRLGALSELQWADPEAKDFDNFIVRLTHMEEIYAAKGWGFHPCLQEASAQVGSTSQPAASDQQ